MSESLHARLENRIEELESMATVAARGETQTTITWLEPVGVAEADALLDFLNAWDPATVLRGLAEDRDILRRHANYRGNCQWCISRRHGSDWPYPCPDLESLARRLNVEVTDV